MSAEKRTGPIGRCGSHAATTFWSTLAGAATVAALAGLWGCAPQAPLSAESSAAQEKVQRLDIVDRAIEHHGGDLFESSRVWLTVSSRSGSFDIATRMAGKTFEHEITATKDGETTVHRQTNDSLTLTVDGQEQPLSEERERTRAQSYVNQRMYFLFLPYKLNDPGTYKEDLGLEEGWGDKPLHKVRVSFEPGTSDGASSQYMYWFDPDSAELVQFAYDYSEGTGLRFRKLFNHRRVGGLLFYDAQNYGVNTRSGGLSVNLVTPEYAKAELPLVSTIELSDIRVERQ